MTNCKGIHLCYTCMSCPTFCMGWIASWVTYYDLVYHLMIARLCNYKWHVATQCFHCLILNLMKCKTTKFISLPMLEPSLTYLCHVILHDAFVVCTHKSCYASTWYFNFGRIIYICFLSTMPFILNVHLMGLKLKWYTYKIAHLLFCIVILSLFAWPYYSCGTHSHNLGAYWSFSQHNAYKVKERMRMREVGIFSK